MPAQTEPRSVTRDALFTSTRWTLVENAAGGHGGADLATRALTELCRTYWPAIYGYLRRRGYGTEEAQDLTQSLFQDILEHGTLRRASAAKGRFRSFLIGALKLRVAAEHNHSHALKRGGAATFVPLDALQSEELHHQCMSRDLTPDEMLDARWAGLLIEQALRGLRSEMEHEGKAEVFEVLAPFIGGGDTSITYEAAAASLGLGLGATKSLILRARRRFARILRWHISQTVSAPEAVDEELRALRIVFARTGQGHIS